MVSASASAAPDDSRADVTAIAMERRAASQTSGGRAVRRGRPVAATEISGASRNTAAAVITAASASRRQPPGAGGPPTASSPAPNPAGTATRAASAAAPMQMAICTIPRAAARPRSKSKRNA